MSRVSGTPVSINASRASLDGAAEYLRHRGSAVTRWYLLAVCPLLAAAWWWVGCVATGDRLGLGPASLALALAMLWRWAWLAQLQRVVMLDMGMPCDALTAGRIFHIVLIRLAAHVGMGWGAILIFPGLWSFYLSAFAAPVMLSPEHARSGALRHGLSLVSHHLTLLARHCSMLSCFVLLAFVAMAVAQITLLTTIMPSLMGIDPADAIITMRNVSWILFSALVVLLLFDLYWSVGAVLLMQQLEARRTGADLMARLTALKEAAP